MNGTQVFYDSLRSLGPISEDEVPDAITSQIMSSGVFQGDMQQVKATVALYSTLAASMNMASFANVLETGILPDARELNIDEKMLAAAGRSCCGHTCEGTCTK